MNTKEEEELISRVQLLGTERDAMEVRALDAEATLAHVRAEGAAQMAKLEKEIVEAEDELGAIKEAVTQHLPSYVSDDDDEEGFDEISTIEQVGRDISHDKAKAAALESELAQVGIQLAAARERLALAMVVVDAAREAVVTSAPGMTKLHDHDIDAVRDALDALDAVPGDVKAPPKADMSIARSVDYREASGVDVEQVSKKEGE